ncbi:hypothetical protein VC83_00731 [Pseudogymnoascus destructans]|uniref:Uncharacterized protein n=1 Tax=Pseudogymnoascus destructans TaxID=655981 RepID=A0A177AK39_9PEZI|nr:uncharacterized protein VC83_00731 [Pseudogymnoascus destructans]OAF62428.1 hypothetical protein VC83_00731 [Pseudogymnoascus destructans]
MERPGSHRSLSEVRSVQRYSDADTDALLDDLYTLEQLKDPRMNIRIVRPLVDPLYDPDDIRLQPSVALQVTPVYCSSSDRLSKSTAQITAAYRNRYASYLAATFNISLEAAQLETDYQLAPRRASEFSEAEAHRS